VEIINRTEWQARDPHGRRQLSSSRGLVLHWNGGAVRAAAYRGDRDAVAAYLRAVQRNHMDTDRLASGGAFDVGYNFAVDNAGRVWELRGWGIQGAHAPGANANRHGVLCVLGDGQQPSAAMLRALVQLAGEHDRRHGSTHVTGHQDHSPTTCPGPELGQVGSVADLERMAAEKGGPDTGSEQAGDDAQERSYVTVGDAGSRVLKWQQLLSDLLPDHQAAHRPDGDFGPLTRQLTLDAYELVGLNASDPSRPRVGSRSFDAVEEAIKEREQGPPVELGRLLRIQRPYQRGEDVAAVQDRLRELNYNAGSSGIYGPRTAAGVTAFQRAAGIGVDGIVGPQTWGALWSR